MGLIALKCPNCGGDVQFKDNMQYGFCIYCGCKIINEHKSIIVSANNSEELKSTIVLAETSIRSGDYQRASELVQKALETDSEISDAWYIKALLDKSRSQHEYHISLEKAKHSSKMYNVFGMDDIKRIPFHTVSFRYRKGYSALFYTDIQITVDKLYTIGCNRGETVKFELIEGKHEIAIDSQMNERSNHNLFTINADGNIEYNLKAKFNGSGFELK